MRYLIGLAASGWLVACDEQPSDFGTRTSPASDFTPVALEPTKVWLEGRGGSVPENEVASELTTTELAARHGTPVPGAPGAAARETSPPDTATLAAFAFRDVCIASLPSMKDAAGRLANARARNFGAGSDNDISMSLTTASNRCAISVQREDSTEIANALVVAVADAGYGLRPTSANDAQQAWSVIGAPEGTLLKLNVKKRGLGQQQTEAWIAWL